MAYDYRINAQAPTQGISPFQAGQQMGSGFGKLSREIVGGYREGQQQEQDAVKKQKIDALVMKYNNPNSPEFQGLDGKQRALKLSRLLYPLDETMASRYEQQARSVEEKTSLFEQQEKLKRLGLKDNEKNAFNAKLGILFKGINDKTTWDAERSRYKDNKTGLFIPEWESATRQAWIDNAIMLGTKTVSEKALTTDQKKTIINKGYQELLKSPEDYKKWYDALDEKTRANVEVPAPSDNKDYLRKALSVAGADVKGVLELGKVEKESKLAETMATGKSSEFGDDSITFLGNAYNVSRQLTDLNRNDINKLRNEYKGQAKDLEKSVRGVRESKNAIKKYLDMDGDRVFGIKAVVPMFRFMKGIDEGGIVRDSDLAMLMSSLGLVEQVEGGILKLKEGISVTKAQLQDMYDYLDDRVTAEDTTLLNLASDYADDAIFNKVHPSLVIGNSTWQRNFSPLKKKK